jgi:hypothetical protein
MRRSSLAVTFILALVVVPQAYAIRLGGERVVVPIIGRFPGVGGTQWQTDVFLSNPYEPGHTVTLRFYPFGEAVQERTVSIGQYSNVTLTDICLTTFGRANTGGMLEVVTADHARVQVRARIYNIGNPAGQFGQNVPGIEWALLNRQAHMFGLSASSANRLNLGIANPNDVPADATIVVRSANNTTLHSRTITVQPHQVTLFNDLASTFGLALQEGLTVEVNSLLESIYGYVSEVRNDTGDAVFVFGLSPNG